jgi:hypothetical protein
MIFTNTSSIYIYIYINTLSKTSKVLSNFEYCYIFWDSEVQISRAGWDSEV